jgi:polyisoprenyl-phosphate glycosyltransferase
MISIVVPVYRSQNVLPELCARLTKVLDGLGTEYEIVLVDDGSSDGSWDVLETLQKQYSKSVVAVQLMRNFGQHNALMCGFRHTQGQFVITMDDDLQNPPEEIPKLIKAIEDGGYDLVYGVPGRKQHAFGRNVGSRVVNAFFRIVFRLQVTTTSFRAIRRELLDSILSYNLNFTYIDGLLAWNSTRIGEVTVEHHARTSGRSGYSIAKLLTLALNLFANFSLLPLQFASIVGILASVAGLFVGGYYLTRALLNNIAVPGFASIIVAVMTLGGLQLLALGVIGEYIGRMHLNVNRKPQYTIRTIKRSEKSNVPMGDNAHVLKG